MRCQRTATSIMVCSNMWPMCSDPVTFGGGMTMEKTRVPGLLRVRAINARFDPPLRPMRLKALGLIDLLKLHGKSQRIIRWAEACEQMSADAARLGAVL